MFIGWPLHPSLKGCGASPHPLKDARPETRDCVSRCSVALHTASPRLAERNRYVALRSLFMSGLDAPVSPSLQFRLRRFPPARLSRGKDRRLVLERDCQCKLPYTVLPRISRIKTVACRGLRPCPLCHLCPAQPRLTPSLHPAPNSTGHLLNARFSVGANFNVITRPKDAAGNIYICSLGAVVLPHASFLM